ncbi:LacI family DNA-binding transcriptional regulator [Amycolatopsis sp. 195334CR]|uniref:LacI family DNA-binding transcriptional regulator n=1 Tax=Amycolatopsis sp. 195334CR TaxID=2814588 RepID=UPI0027DC8E6E|nr:LacI family DNA-binding transcriptional regulator [Amycolatopsis sp. 195334CR]
MTRRPTMADIAREAGVSKGAVSYALNGRTGVSASTRRRIVRIAGELGWRPYGITRGGRVTRADAVGLVLARPARFLALEPFMMALVSGVEAELGRRKVALRLQVVRDHREEISTYRRWWTGAHVDGVLVLDLAAPDERVTELARCGLPALVLGGPDGLGPLPGLWSDDTTTMHTVVDHLVTLGHRRIARIAGPARLRHTATRTAAMTHALQRHRLPPGVVINTDYGGDEGAAAARRLLDRRPRPTAIICDSDVLAVVALGVATRSGLAVPGGLSLVAWDDSALCELARPALTAVSRDVAAYGAHAARLLLQHVGGQPVATRPESLPRLVVRHSTARPDP